MYGAAICNIDGIYRGLGRNNSIPDFLEDGTCTDILQAFLEEHTDFATQTVAYTPAAIAEALRVARLLGENDCACEVILFCGVDESVDIEGADFIGYDVVGSSLFESPLARGLLDADVNEDTVDTYRPFFARKHRELVTDATADCNDCKLLATPGIAQSIADLLNELTAGKYAYLFDGETDFTVVKVYLCT